MYARQYTSEEMHTIAEAQRIIKRARQRRREELLHKAAQKALGILALCTVVGEMVIGEGGTFIFMLPLGIWLLFTRKTIV